ncbi:MAG: hypothetical protein VB137_09495 [Burkholderia sp.]
MDAFYPKSVSRKTGAAAPPSLVMGYDVFACHRGRHVVLLYAFVESLFRTAKYRPEFPVYGFADLDMPPGNGRCAKRSRPATERHRRPLKIERAARALPRQPIR